MGVLVLSISSDPLGSQSHPWPKPFSPSYSDWRKVLLFPKLLPFHSYRCHCAPGNTHRFRIFFFFFLPLPWSVPSHSFITEVTESSLDFRVLVFCSDIQCELWGPSECNSPIDGHRSNPRPISKIIKPTTTSPGWTWSRSGIPILLQIWDLQVKV